MYVIYRLISLTSKKGKTLVGVTLIRELRDLNVSLGVIKHSAHGVDVKDKDSSKYIGSGASYVIVISKGELGYFTRVLSDNLAEALKYIPTKPSVILVEGYKSEEVGKVIAVIRELNEFKEIKKVVKGKLFAVVNLGKSDIYEINGVKVYTLDTIRKLALAIRDDSYRDILKMLPRTNCGMCKYGACNVMAEAILRGEAQLSDCATISKTKVVIDGKLIPLNPFVKNVVRTVSESLISVLKNIPKSYKKLVIEIEKE